MTAPGCSDQINVGDYVDQFFERLVKKFSDPKISNWIDEIEAVPLYVTSVPEANRTLEVFIASVVQANDCLGYFTEESVEALTQQLLDKRPDLFPSQCREGEAAFRLYAQHCIWSFQRQDNVSRYLFFCAKARLKQSSADEVAQWVTNEQEAMVFVSLYEDRKLIKTMNNHIRAFLIRSDFSL